MTLIFPDCWYGLQILAELRDDARGSMREEVVDQSICPVCMGEGALYVGPFNERLACACCAGTGRLERGEE